MKKIIDVFTGEVKTGDANNELNSHAIGSCIVVTVFNPENCSGGMAHIMLPGRAPDKNDEKKTKYAYDGIVTLLSAMNLKADEYDKLEICLIGGANVLKSENDAICEKNINSVFEILKTHNLNIKAKALGGTIYRTVRFDIETGKIFVREGDTNEELL